MAIASQNSTLRISETEAMVIYTSPNRLNSFYCWFNSKRVYYKNPKTSSKNIQVFRPTGYGGRPLSCFKPNVGSFSFSIPSKIFTKYIYHFWHVLLQS